ncbi:hypothetical protein [Gracilibacillus alcaliphilus]|uniref:hypothetical protein n=1 Tax=Gracilibacillus alcaliphilus TaxID=1401441 RepID=UPI00195751CD|nr:hypothetical protein [Gracilibacillus alcaliphilus]MBM7675126.1 outer membrane protein assembly factor BamA [Gracilibacillus alcaliphilus]
MQDRKVNSKKDEYEDFQTVQSQKEELISEELPEGAYGSAIEASLEKSDKWEEGQHVISNFTYENRKLHAGNERKYPGAHKTHSEGKGEDAD